jgi:GntR family phosphonate transport system transcriptional regulator
LPGIDQAFRKFGDQPTKLISFGKIFKSFGVSDFRRKSVRIRSRSARPDEARDLQMAPSDHVLETDVTLVDPSDTPLCYANTSYTSSRVELVLDL